MTLDETSQPFELLLAVTRDGTRTLGGQIEERAAASDRAGLAACLAEYEGYLARVKVVYE